MKQKKILFISLLLLGMFLIGVYQVQQQKKIDCSHFDVVYITHSELKYAEEISNKINGVVVIPEDNQFIARTEILKCPNFDYTNYIKVD